MTREFFIAIDPITTVHMGICNAPDTLARAHALAAALRARHRDFMEDPGNLPEYAAIHYMDAEVRAMAEQRLQRSISSGHGASGAGRSPSHPHKQAAAHQQPHLPSQRPEQKTLSERKEKEVDRYRHTSNHSADAGCAVYDILENVEEGQDHPQHILPNRDLLKPAEKPSEKLLSPKLIPTLEQIFKGDSRLILTHGRSVMSLSESENVYAIIVQQGCRDTSHFTRLILH